MAYPSKTSAGQITEAAVAIVATTGLRGLSLRAVASSLGVTPMTIYRYFADVSQLEAAVGARVSAALLAVLIKATEGHSPEAAIRAVATAYLRFARDHQLRYEALLVPRPESGEDAVAPKELWDFFTGQVARLVGTDRAGEAAMSLWAFLHGVAALQSARVFNEEKPFSSVVFGLSAWLAAARLAGEHSVVAPDLTP
ncbi:AcrR family transcriptional regulator [Luteibacter sp. HA06]|jgi:AcrR family transcriptional regulator